MKVYCVFALELPQGGNSYEYTQYTIFNMRNKNSINYPKSAARFFLQGTQECVRNSRGKRVRSIEVLLYTQTAAAQCTNCWILFFQFQ